MITLLVLSWGCFSYYGCVTILSKHSQSISFFYIKTNFFSHTLQIYCVGLLGLGPFLFWGSSQNRSLHWTSIKKKIFRRIIHQSKLVKVIDLNPSMKLLFCPPPTININLPQRICYENTIIYSCFTKALHIWLFSVPVLKKYICLQLFE